MAIRTNPSYATAHENLGDVYAKLASQAYNKALQLDNTNTAVAPKLALIRELFSANVAKGQRPAPVPAAAAPAPAPIPPVAVKPPPTLPTQVAAKAPPAPVAAPAPAAAPVPVHTPTPAAVAPVVVTPPPAAAPAPAAPAAGNSNREAEAAVKAWANAWAAKDMKNYLASYGKEFVPPSSMSRSQWEAERKQRIGSKNNISIKLENLVVTAEGSKATAKFRQDYKASGLSVSSRKTLDLVKTGDRWQIVRESTGN
jgi:ketosteroid isomerase-like protein